MGDAEKRAAGGNGSCAADAYNIAERRTVELMICLERNGARGVLLAVPGRSLTDIDWVVPTDVRHHPRSGLCIKGPPAVFFPAERAI